MKKAQQKQLYIWGGVVIAVVVGYLALQYSGLIKTQIFSGSSPERQCQDDVIRCVVRASMRNDRCVEDAKADYKACYNRVLKLPIQDRSREFDLCNQALSSDMDQCFDNYGKERDQCFDDYEKCMAKIRRSTPTPGPASPQSGQTSGFGPGPSPGF